MKVSVFGSEYQTDKHNIVRQLFEKLNARKAEVYIDTSFYAFLTDKFGYAPPKTGLLKEGEPFRSDIALSVGGDGTFLRTAVRIGKQNIPILGINTGRLGFLADIGSREIEETLDDIFDSRFRIEERPLLRLCTEDRRYAGSNYALNEVAILKRDTSSMITIHTSLDDEYLTSYQADGLVIATPTGSTAYSMSVNGPIIVPQSNSFVLSPVAPHSLNVRPLVIPDTTTVTLSVESRSDNFLIALDGRSEVFPAGYAFTVSKAGHTAKLVKLHNRTFYKTLREKLMWGTDVRQC
ncbi:putative inorganic polyphosphate/ATP-NAD kinase [Bacteroidales bacterium Barb4]|nr:putative inorganic polyphosphate/ATP-NAD kinase [Bacteroidales bacterium Barb4]